MKPADSYAIAALMVWFPNWKRTEKVHKLPIYGRQRIYERLLMKENLLEFLR